MNRISLVADHLWNYASDFIISGKYPNREMSRSSINYWISIFVNLFFKGYLGAEYIDSENIPEVGPALVAGNHFSHLDGLLINGASIMKNRRPVVFLAAADVYEKNKAFKIMCDLVNCIPVKRGESDMVALLKTVRLLKSGQLFGIFPEGQRSRDGTIGEGQDGVAALALSTGAPVIPVGISGTFEALPRKTKLIKPAKVRLKFGKPLVWEKERHPSPETVKSVKDKIMETIAKLHGEIAEGGAKKQKIAA